MNLKLFNIRLNAENAPQDQEVINGFMNSVTVKKSATQYVPGNPDLWSILVYYEEANGSHPKEKTKTNGITEAELNDDEKQVLAALRTWRKDKANEAQIAEFMILQNATLYSLAKEKPRMLNALNEIKGMGAQKIAKYGEDLMAILNAF